MGQPRWEHYTLTSQEPHARSWFNVVLQRRVYVLDNGVVGNYDNAIHVSE